MAARTSWTGLPTVIRIRSGVKQRHGIRGRLRHYQRAGISLPAESSPRNRNLILIRDGKRCSRPASRLVLHLVETPTAPTVEQVRPVVRPLFATGMAIFAATPVPACGEPGFGTFPVAVLPNEKIVPLVSTAPRLI